MCYFYISAAGDTRLYESRKIRPILNLNTIVYNKLKWRFVSLFPIDRILSDQYLIRSDFKELISWIHRVVLSSNQELLKFIYVLPLTSHEN